MMSLYTLRSGLEDRYAVANLPRLKAVRRTETMTEAPDSVMSRVVPSF